jgi:hypothetical protein
MRPSGNGSDGLIGGPSAILLAFIVCADGVPAASWLAAMLKTPSVWLAAPRS